ncbi:MAG: Hemagglutinin [Succiniclasticum sp.]|jgi:hypothetical protein
MKNKKTAWGKSALAAAVLAMVLAGSAVTVYAADEAIGTGNGVALGSGSTANSEGSVALGRSSFSDGKSSIAIGDEAKVLTNTYSFASIAVGKNANALNGAGQQEYEFGFNKDKWNKTGFLRPRYDPKEGTDALDRLAGGIAIGTNAYARTGTVEIGSHTMQGMTMAGVTVDSTSANIIDMTTIGTNSYNKGMMATIVGAYSINTGDFNGSGGWNSLNYGSQNMGSVLVGSLNQNRSKGHGGESGIANTMVGIANTAENANGALIYGAGNKITNSYGDISFDGNYGADTVDELQEKLAAAVNSSQSGGAVLVIGGGNTADYAKRSQIFGVNNTLTGTESDNSEYNLIDGFGVTAANVKHVTVIGAGNTIEDSGTVQLFGDNRKLTNVQNSVILGSAARETELTVSNATLLGYDTRVSAEGGVALGSLSVAERGADEEYGYGYEGPADTTAGVSTAAANTSYVWKPTLGAVSVGGTDSSGTINTRRIVNVAAGLEDTDAVNVAQLKAATANGSGGGTGSANLIAGDGIKLVKGDDGSWTISTNFLNSGSDEITYQDGMSTLDANTSTGSAAVIETKLTADDGNTTSLSVSGLTGVKGDGTNISTSVSGSDVKVALNRDIQVDSVTIHNGPVINNNGIDMHNKKITNVADGDVYEGSRDAVNGGQLWNVQQGMQGMNGRINRLDTKINRVGAGAAALANLHPLDFDPEEKWSFAAGMGNYRNANAMAVGTFYRPNEKTMLNLSGTFGNGENMIGAGVSFQLDRKAPGSRATMAKTITNLKARLSDQQAAMQAQNEKIAALEKLVNQLVQSK